MILPPPKRPRSTEENILPLINIVFLLLIFFMLAGVLARNPPFPLDPPHTTQASHSTRLERRVLSVAADGRLAFAGKTLGRDQLATALADWPRDKPLQIRVDGKLEARTITGLLAVLRHAGISEVKLLTQHQEP